MHGKSASLADMTAWLAEVPEQPPADAPGDDLAIYPNGNFIRQSAELADSSDPTLSDLTRELQAEAKAQSEAAKEVEALLALSPERNTENPQPA